MPQKAANERGHFILPNIHNNKAVSPMPKFRRIESRVAGEERGPALAAQQYNDLFVLESLVAKIDGNLPRRYSRCLQQQALCLEDVLVENEQE